MINTNFDNFEVNLIPATIRGYEESFDEGPNVIGSSEIAFGMRSNVIKKREGLKLKWGNHLFAGKFIHRGFQKKEVIYENTKDINQKLGYEEKEINGTRFIKLDNGNYIKFDAMSEYDFVEKYPKKEKIEILPGKFFRMHPDVWTTQYCIDFKSTSWPKEMWKDIAPYYLMQLNSYLGFNHHEFGFLLRCDLGFTGLDSKRTGFLMSKSIRPSYIWKNYFTLYPHNFDQELFDFTIKKIKTFFYHMDNTTDLRKIQCPDFIFECNSKCKEFCPNPIEKVKMDSNDKCFHCKGEIRVGTTGLTRNGKMYHYTDQHGEVIKDCEEAAKNAR